MVRFVISASQYYLATKTILKASCIRDPSLSAASLPTPIPKKTDRQHYRDLVAQNEWLRENIFDAMGNYLFCARCVCSAFRISPQRLSRQRNIKRSQSQLPVVEMTKSRVEEERLGEYVVMPARCDQSFKTWWRSLEKTVLVNVCGQ